MEINTFVESLCVRWLTMKGVFPMKNGHPTMRKYESEITSRYDIKIKS